MTRPILFQDPGNYKMQHTSHQSHFFCIFKFTARSSIGNRLNDSKIKVLRGTRGIDGRVELASLSCVYDKTILRLQGLVSSHVAKHSAGVTTNYLCRAPLCHLLDSTAYRVAITYENVSAAMFDATPSDTASASQFK